MACIYRGYRQKHDDKLLLAQRRMPHECVRETCQASPTLLYERCVRSNMIAVDCDAFGRQEWQLPEWVAFVEAIQ